MDKDLIEMSSSSPGSKGTRGADLAKSAGQRTRIVKNQRGNSKRKVRERARGRRRREKGRGRIEPPQL
eukprot:5887118-Pyramimonas_sp.AAC.1